MPKFKFSIKSWTISIIAITTLLVSLGVNTSSSARLSESDSYSANLVLGHPRAIRTDEYLRNTPTEFGKMAGGDGLSKFDALDESTSNAKAQMTLCRLNFDQYVISQIQNFLTENQALALRWWWYTMLLFIFLPRFLLQFGLKLELGALATFIVFFSPTNQWWSYWPTISIATAATSCYLLLSGLKNINDRLTGWKIKSLMSLLSFVILAAQLPFFYQPWSIPVSVFFALITLPKVFDYFKVNLLTKFAVISSASALIVLVSSKLFLMQNQIAITLGTTYPGQRRSEAGSAIPFFTTGIANQLQVIAPSASNQSELSMGYVELSVIALVLLVSATLMKTRISNFRSILAGTVFIAIMLMWAIAAWPSKFYLNNPLAILPPERVAQILGPISVIFFFLVFSNLYSSWSQDKRILLVLATSSSLAIFPLLMTSQSRYGQFFTQPSIPAKYIWIFTILYIFCITYLFKAFSSIKYAIPMVLFGVFSAGMVNPINIGAGDLLQNEISKSISIIQKQSNGLWASDDIYTDTLLIASGVEMISGQQINGPNLNEWKLIDQDETRKDVWNRGASYVNFKFSDGSVTSFENPSPDVIQVALDPCGKDARNLGINYLITSTPLQGTCLTQNSEGSWMGKTRYVYSIN